MELTRLSKGISKSAIGVVSVLLALIGCNAGGKGSLVINLKSDYDLIFLSDLDDFYFGPLVYDSNDMIMSELSDPVIKLENGCYMFDRLVLSFADKEHVTCGDVDIFQKSEIDGRKNYDVLCMENSDSPTCPPNLISRKIATYTLSRDGDVEALTLDPSSTEPITFLAEP